VEKQTRRLTEPPPSRLVGASPTRDTALLYHDAISTPKSNDTVNGRLRSPWKIAARSALTTHRTPCNVLFID
jgi:hypothetical protein